MRSGAPLQNSRLHILLVEDDDVDIELVERALSGADTHLTLTVARNGVEALALLRGQNGHRPVLPALILLDLKMPKLDGIAFLDALRQDRNLRQNIVFVLTNSNLASDKLAAYNHNVAGYLLKSTLGADMGRLLDLLDAYSTLVELPHGPSLLVTPHTEHWHRGVALNTK
jgi:CheY-like chemotaxis protein